MVVIHKNLLCQVVAFNHIGLVEHHKVVVAYSMVEERNHIPFRIMG